MIQPYTFAGMTIPAHMMQALERYIEHGHQPGSFLYAIVKEWRAQPAQKTIVGIKRRMPVVKAQEFVPEQRA